MFGKNQQEHLAEIVELIIQEADKYQVEVAESALDGVIITSSMNDKVDLSVNDKNAKIVITAKPIPAH